MFDLADGFAATPAGYISGIIGVVTIVVLPIFTWILKRLISQMDSTSKSTNELIKESAVQSQALQFLVNAVQPIPQLATDVALVKQKQEIDHPSK